MGGYESVGNGQFFVGDCLDVMARISAESVDMILADLPYGTTACAWDSVIPFDELWRHYWRVCKQNAIVVLTASQPFTSAAVMSQIKHFKTEWIWKKNAGSNFAQMKFVPMKEHESCLVFCRGRGTYNPQMQQRAESGLSRSKYKVKMDSCGTGKGDCYGIEGSVTKTIPDLRYPSSVQTFNRQRGLHPTQKPVELFEYLIRTYTNPDDLVLDNVAGSGTTAIAAENSGRRWLCIEKDKKYANAAIERIRSHTEP